MYRVNLEGARARAVERDCSEFMGGVGRMNGREAKEISEANQVVAKGQSEFDGRIRLISGLPRTRLPPSLHRPLTCTYILVYQRAV